MHIVLKQQTTKFFELCGYSCEPINFQKISKICNYLVTLAVGLSFQTEEFWFSIQKVNININRNTKFFVEHEDRNKHKYR